MTTALPLFPLGTVLFPGLVLPLHVFEERYRALVRHIMALPEGTYVLESVADEFVGMEQGKIVDRSSKLRAGTP